MKATIDIPEALYREVKVKAAQEGVALRTVVVRALEKEMSVKAHIPFQPFDHGTGVTIPALTNEEIDELLHS